MKEVYHASVSKLIDLIKRTKNIHSNICCIIGHEPTFSYFIKSITDKSISKFPTATMAKIVLKLKAGMNLITSYLNCYGLKSRENYQLINYLFEFLIYGFFNYLHEDSFKINYDQFIFLDLDKI